MHVAIASRGHRAPGRLGGSGRLQAEDQSSKSHGTSQNYAQHFRCLQFWSVLPVKVEPDLPVACDGGHRTCDWYRAMATPSISAIAAEGGAGAARRLSVPGPRKSLPG